MSRRHVLTIDVGGTTTRVALVDDQGQVVRRTSLPTQARAGREQALERILQACRLMMVEVPSVEGVGIAVPGPVELPQGVLFNPPNLPGWDRLPIKDLFEAQLQRPVKVDNDANAAAMGEYLFGIGSGVRDLVYFTVSTGIGGGVIIDGKLLRGPNGFAGELGHITIDRNGPRCNCGNTGCLEALASGTAIARMVVERLRAGGAASAIMAMAEGNLENVTAALVFKASYQKDPLAQEVLRGASGALALGVVSCIHIFSPRLVILGGGVCKDLHLCYPTLLSTIQKNIMANMRGRVSVVPSLLWDDAGLLGAAALFFGEPGEG